MNGTSRRMRNPRMHWNVAVVLGAAAMALAACSSASSSTSTAPLRS